MQVIVQHTQGRNPEMVYEPPQALRHPLSRPGEEASSPIHCKQAPEANSHQFIQHTSGSIRVVKGVSRPLQRSKNQGSPSKPGNIRMSYLECSSISSTKDQYRL